MPDRRAANRTMFWRIVRRLLAANRPRLFMLLLALGAGAAITAALLNLQVDAQRRLTTEFRAFGANVIVAPHNSQTSAPVTLSDSLVKQIPREFEGQPVSVASVLYVVGQAYKSGETPHSVVIAGSGASSERCAAGTRAASQIHLQQGDAVVLRVRDAEVHCNVEQILSTGGAQDNQIVTNLQAAQRVAGLPGRISLIEIGVPGRPAAIEGYVASLQKLLPDAEVRPLRQFAEAESKIYNRISGLLTATVALVLVLTALCVMAGMTNAAMERKSDVGLMKAIGGATRRVMRIFVAEAAVLGLVGGILGAAAGIALSTWLGYAVFGVAARPRLIVYPVSVLLTVIVAIAGAFPLRRLASIRPASVFRGEA